MAKASNIAGTSGSTGALLSGRYRLEEHVGSGGMSSVYRAFDTVLERNVAIKLMHREIAADSAQLERFRREARAVAQLSHPHVVGVIDAGEDEGRPYIVLELVVGETLKERIRRCGPLPVPEAVAYAIEIARALGAAHARNIVHRDVKPQNVLIDEEGSAKVADFGIARSLDEEGLTADGRVMGTTDYVAPEQALGQGAGPRSDLYSLGVVLWEMLAGAPPFTGENQVAVAMKHVREEVPDIQERRPEVSAALAAVLDRLTDKDPARRPASAEELVADLEEVLAIESARAGRATGEATAVLRTLPAEKRRRLPLRLRYAPAVLGLLAVAAAAVAAVVVGFGAERTNRGTGTTGEPPPRPEQAEVSLKQRAALAFDPRGDGEENQQDASAAIDRDPNTDWHTERYEPLFFKEKGGVGLILDLRPGVSATWLRVRTATPGWRARVYAAGGARPTGFPAGWAPVSGAQTARGERVTFSLDTRGRRYRWYLLWFSAVPPAPSGQRSRIEVQEVSLFRTVRRSG
jgi:serine/threonine-protein kinase